MQVTGATTRDPDRGDTDTDDQQPQLRPVSNGASQAQLTAQLLNLPERAATTPEIEQAKARSGSTTDSPWRRPLPLDPMARFTGVMSLMVAGRSSGHATRAGPPGTSTAEPHC